MSVFTFRGGEEQSGENTETSRRSQHEMSHQSAVMIIYVYNMAPLSLQPLCSASLINVCEAPASTSPPPTLKTSTTPS